MDDDRPDADSGFTGSVPEIYERYMVPLVFATSAEDLARRVAEQLAGATSARVLEVAAGSGVATRAMASALPDSVLITASDLNQPMLDHAASIGTSRTVEWRQADAMALPFDHGAFDVVVCQFGVMFFPDRAAGYAEVLRVLRPGGVFIFSTWSRIVENEFPHEIEETLARRYPHDPPRFMSRTPHGYFAVDVIRSDLEKAGFVAPPVIDTLDARSRATSPDVVAMAFCQGTPLRSEIEVRDPDGVDAATDECSAAIERRFGSTNLDAQIRGLVITASAPAPPTDIS